MTAPIEAPPGESVPEERLALTEAESDVIEREHFDLIERETTQPVRRYSAFEDAPESAVPWYAEAQSRHEPPVVADSQPARTFEPRPFAVPAPSEARSHQPEPQVPSPPVMEHPPVVEADPAEPDQPPSVEQPELPAAASELAHVPQFSLVVPAREERVEPTFARSAPTLDHLPAPAAPLSAEPEERRDWRDIARRAASAAFLIFAGWFVAVLLLIVAYRFIDPPFSMLMAQRFLTGTAIDKEWVPIDRISANLSRAVIVAEDGRFCQHWGVDPVETMNAIRRSSGGYPRGASTITMQVAKNLFLVPTKSYLRKMVEIPLTFAIELVWSKTRILEVYLNIVEWGPGVFGAEAASRAHFGRPAAALSSRQAAQLAAVLPNPIVRDAGAPGPRTARKATVIQTRAARSPEASNCIEHRR